MATVYIGIGSNIGDKKANCEEAVARLCGISNIFVTAQSTLYPTRPVGGPPQEEYMNGVVKIETDILPKKLLDTVKGIEEDMGRSSDEERNGPRIIDLDLLMYGDIRMDTDKLKLPHPRMHERYFVLKGLANMASGVIHPTTSKTIEELYWAVKDRQER
jgi:2-amino-4-hydroxy-6-hydroxymethyldihydropteridine diphosphokinase